MKISKLFHWLYAFLMLSPCFAVLFTCLYVSFNPNAKDSYSGELLVHNQTFIVDNLIDFEINQTYTMSLVDVPDSFVLNTGNTCIYFNSMSFRGVDYENGYFNLVHNNNTSIYLSVNGSAISSSMIFDNANLIVFNYGGVNTLTDTTFAMFKFTYMYNNYDYYLDNVFYYSLGKVCNNLLFRWASTSFLASPILYITSLFGMPSSSPIIVLLSYWLSISVIWLVFDLIMYVPLLAHRWLDKGVLE